MMPRKRTTQSKGNVFFQFVIRYSMFPFVIGPVFDKYFLCIIKKSLKFVISDRSFKPVNNIEEPDLM